ncbi:2,3-bisphosphoglycerate-independent phosphoglycerate mutase [Serpentinicella alkaliphila]|uniref:2,3-bisphosphoglycerate-independent phosphoglycerate mutase n=1 Tax=Serpentinicella alkaliphila TaxID=1734049 RepID=A0A4R2U3A3_9FIRM|nr:2,3-bisphosphoglycerate-independent phosphoglycerate mutase [Serpentinicella alkaliphila]QUH25997.1 2,3-bisphosphoglycerate-independent phosphoglycerate mutase [Serpentinicella alkaliphila]TCQ02143.1 phosphoglycerate mutase [Serpentinicella alkaliphila]
MKKPVALIILDGFGLSDENIGNAVKKAHLPNYNKLINRYPHTKIQASGLAVGLPEGQMGNSEVGHLNIGAGRIVYQELTRISREVKIGKFFKNETLLRIMKYVNNNNKKLHLMGLLSDGGVHSHIEHLFALIDMAKENNLKDLVIHCFLDGRDTPPKSATEYITQLQEKVDNIGIGRISTVSGRYYSMDRDRRWERTVLAYDALVQGKGRKAKTALEAVTNAYVLGENDEFVTPTVITNDTNFTNDCISEGDGVIFFNFRPDRARQITKALVEKEFDGFQRETGYIPLNFVTMTLYDKTIEDVEIAYKPQNINNTLGEYLSNSGYSQLRIAETEKYAHVTYFFNGGIEKSYDNEDRKLIKSPEVATYDLKPEMSAIEVTKEVINALDEDKYDFIVLNYANPDMVGHTGDISAVIKALEVVDRCLGQVIDKIEQKHGKAIVTSDHGNAEEMINLENGTPITAHTTNLVPCIVINGNVNDLRMDGKLCDIAPTLLELLGLEQPREMTGKSLLKI